MNPRMLEDDFHDDRPYREGDVYICRNCAAELTRRAVYCVECYRRLYRESQRVIEEDSDV